MRSPLWSIPITSRPPHFPLLHSISFSLLFNLSILTIYLILLLLFISLRLLLLPGSKSKRQGKVWHSRLGKGLFGKSLVVVSKLFFGDLEFVVSRDRAGGEEKRWVERDSKGKVIGIKVPKRSIWISNHQTLADWLFLWQFFYLTSSSSTLYIALKSSLKKIPIIGQACGWFGFAFLERNWSKDKAGFERQLEEMARDCQVEGEGGKLDFLLFPEGTIVTENTRGISSRFAEKAKLKDFEYTLLPRSTGLFFALRQLAIRVPDLQLSDLTVGYPLPRQPPSSSTTDRKPLYPSEYYSLPSIFLNRVPPPELHFHLRFYKVSEIPLGDLSRLNEKGKEGDDGSEEERRVFDEWLLKRWGEKDSLLKRFNETGSFVDQSVKVTTRALTTEDEDEEDQDRVRGEVSWKPRLRSPIIESLQIVGFGLPFVALGWGLPLLWKAGKMVVGASAAAVEARKVGGEGSGVKAGCGCGKMGGGSAGGLDVDRSEL
ncbi:hypothetical protein JCM16303_007136 [Sporobolomyces ruberrimus]